MPLVRKRPEDKSERWQPNKAVRLYLDDIDDLIGILRQEGEVIAETEDFIGTIERASDLRALGEDRLDALVLQAGPEEPPIRVSLLRPVHVQISQRDRLSTVGAAQRVHDVLDSRRRRFGGLGSWEEPWSMARLGRLGPIGLVLIAILTLVYQSMESFSEYPLSAIVLVATGTFAVSFILAFVWKGFVGPAYAPSATIVLTYRAEAPTWWERNRTAVLIGVATNVIVGLAFFLLGLLLS